MAESQAHKKRRGRGGPGRAEVHIRLPIVLLQRISKAADVSGRSTNNEFVHWLEEQDRAREAIKDALKEKTP